MPYDFRDLTGDQRALLACGGWEWQSEMRSEPPNEITGELIARGLLVIHHSHERIPWGGLERRGQVRRRYEVPTDVAAAWWQFLAAEEAQQPWRAAEHPPTDEDS